MIYLIRSERSFSMHVFFDSLFTWIDLVLFDKYDQSWSFWFLLNNERPSEQLVRLMSGESFRNPTYLEMVDSNSLEGITEPPTIQEYLKYRENVKCLGEFF